MIHFGLIPEFIGRFPIITHTSELTLSELIAILYQPTNAIMKQYSYYFALYDIELICTDQANQAIAQIAHNKKTGARGLRSIVERILTPAMFLIPSQTDSVTGLSGHDVLDHDAITQSLKPHRHPSYHAIIIDELAAKNERGVILLTHQITKDEYMKLSLEEVNSDSRINIASLDHLF